MYRVSEKGALISLKKCNVKNAVGVLQYFVFVQWCHSVFDSRKPYPRLLRKFLYISARGFAFPVGQTEGVQDVSLQCEQDIFFLSKTAS